MAKELVSWKVVSRDSTRRHQEKPRNTETGSGNGTTELRVFYLFIFRERKGGRKAKKHLSATYCMCPVWDRTRNPGMCPGWELNQQPFALQDDAQPTEPHWSVSLGEKNKIKLRLF